ncbi:MAG: T9SS type A sorting domain-containing protein, partial [Bacteroidales bacterium]|nr:T9SS type A sorting domain-containing protein [Bacteroidales bacterium]
TCAGGTVNKYGIYSLSCTGYKIEGNDFYTTNISSSSIKANGIRVSSSGTDANSIHKNTFEKLDNGVWSDSNPGLQVSCNEFSNNFGPDIYTTGNFPSQGSSSESAGNMFTTGASMNICSIESSFLYYHSGLTTGTNQYRPTTSSNVTNVPNITANECDPTICLLPGTGTLPGVLGSPSASSIDDISLYESLQQIYDSRFADYNAAGYGFLLENFNEEDADIVATARLMQDTLISLRRTMAEIANRNIDAILQDTVVFDRESLNGWYNRMNTTTAKYSLVNSYFEMGEYALARQELAMIPQRFALTADELAEYDNFCHYQSLREAVYTDGRNYAQLTEDEIAELQVIVERNTGVSSAYANSVLCFFYGICRDEETDIDFDIDAPMNSKSTTEVAEKSTSEEPLAIYVYPNPANDELNIILNSLPGGGMTIEFHDVAGRLMLAKEISSTNARIDISSLPQGVYMCRIINGDNIIARDRIVKE